MANETNSVDELPLGEQDRTKHGQEYEDSLKFHEDIDNSLVFGNDASPVKPSPSSRDATTQADKDNNRDTQLFNSDTIIHEVEENEDEAKDVINADGNTTNIDETQRIRQTQDTQESGMSLFQESQGISQGPSHIPEDTQVISRSPNQSYAIKSQNYQETQIVHNQDTQLIQKKQNSQKLHLQNYTFDTQRIEPGSQTQVIKSSEESNGNGTSRLNREADTQIIGPIIEPDTQVITPLNSQKIGERQTQVIQTPGFPSSYALSQPFETSQGDPNKAAHRQVVNTQEQSDIGLAEEYSVDHVSSDEEVVTDEERNKMGENDNEVDIEVDISGLGQPDDSLFTHKLRKNRRLEGSPVTNSKSAKYQPFKSFNVSSGSKISSVQLHPKSDPIVMEPTSEVVESSPFVKHTDILRLPASSSPSKVIDKDSDNEIEETMMDLSLRKDNTSDVHLDPSDPSQDSQQLKEDVSMKINSRKKRRYIVESQPEADENVAQIAPNSSPVKTEIKKTFREEPSRILPQDCLKYQDSVWATYNLKVYAGKIIQRGIEQSVIEFSEGLSTIKNADLHLLDIRIGDVIRIRSSTAKFRVTGLNNSSSINDGIICSRGYNLVYIVKQSTKSNVEDTVALSECYMELSDWILHQETYGLVEDGQSAEEPIPRSPTSKRNQRTQRRNQTRTQHTRASKKSTMSFIAPSISTPLPETPIPSKSVNGLSALNNQIFHDKLFCITSIDGERKDQIKSLIESNGGILVEEGLNELFEYTETNDHLALSSAQLGSIKFGCMISNNYCRSAKYLQALALGWPILSDTYIVDCVADPSRVQDWPVYLLPAGQSTYLNSVKSLDIFNYRTNYDRDGLLVDQLHNNGTLLNNYKIIVMNNRINNNTLETCRFIFYTFGAKYLTYCASHSELTDQLRELGNSHRILVYDDSGVVQEKFQKNPRKKQKKRKDNTTQADQVSVGVIDWEWVVQCVISTYIWNTTTFQLDLY